MLQAEPMLQAAMAVAPSLSVCGDSWFILGAMIALMHHRCAAPPSQSPISLTQARWGCKPAINHTHSTHTLHSHFASISK